MNPRFSLAALLAGLCFISATAQAAQKGDAVYAKACAACHAGGIAGAPKFGDAGAWKARIATGLPALTKSALGGKGAMPARGGHDDLSDDDVKNAVIHMANAAGAKFK